MNSYILLYALMPQQQLNCSAFTFFRDLQNMSPEKDERVGKGGSMVKKLAPSNICENDSKSIQDEEEVVSTVTQVLPSFRRPN